MHKKEWIKKGYKGGERYKSKDAAYKSARKHRDKGHNAKVSQCPSGMWEVYVKK